MANYSGIKEGTSTSRPPLFDGSNYAYWKNRMSIYIQACDYKQWRIIINGPHVITKINEAGLVVPKLESEWDDSDIEKIQCNARSLNTLHCALSMEEYNKISSCKTAKEIWDKLEVANEGTSQVKEDNINMLVHDYELFAMDENESLTSMYSRFLVITNALSGLGKDYSNHDKIRKLLRVLPKKWRPKVTAIQEAKNLHTLSLDELIGSLKTHEKELAREDKRDAKPVRNLALKSNNDDDDSSSEASSEEDDMHLLSKKLIKLLAKKKNSQRKFSKTSSRRINDKSTQSRVDNDEVRKCFHCHKIGHLKTDCLTRIKEKKDKKYKKVKHVLKETLSDSDESESNDDSSNDEEANLCLMAIDDDEVTSILASFSDFDDSDNNNYDDQNNYDELLEMFELLHSKFEELSNKYANLKKQNSIISSQHENLEKENIDFKNEISYLKKEKEKVVSKTLVLENDELKIKVKDLTNNLAKFTNGKKNLDKLLGAQRCVFNKAGLGYNQVDNQKDHKNFFVTNTSNESTSFCSYCGRHTHEVQHCYYKNNEFAKRKLAWVPKGTIMFANPKGPNTFWVPKEKLLKVIV